MDYNDRLDDQSDIKQFTDNVISSMPNQRMNYEQYAKINKEQSSEMFYSLMSILHEKLPCSANYFRMRRKFKEQYKECQSPTKLIASPNIMRGLKKSSPDYAGSGSNQREEEGIVDNNKKAEFQSAMSSLKLFPDRDASPHKINRKNKLLR